VDQCIDLSVNFLGCVPIVGSTIPIGVGAAFGASLQDRRPLTVIFFGDAAVETGVFHESVNFAALHNLPILFACENNLYSVNTPLAPRQPNTRSIADLARGHGIESHQCDGQKVEQIYALAVDIFERLRDGKGPALVEFMTYRWAEHCGPLDDLHLGYRTQAEFQAWSDRCPILLHRALLEKAGILSASSENGIRQKVEEEIDAAIEFARQSSFPDRSALAMGVFA
jgi:TPP-dependent pyruvate/acetoin dehydrogenase alpha subunit